MLKIVVLVVLVQALRYLLFEQKTFRNFWRRFDNTPLLSTFESCAFCQGFWIGLAVFWPLLGILQGVVWGFMSAWISATWDQWAHGRKAESSETVPKDETEEAMKAQTLKTVAATNKDILRVVQNSKEMSNKNSYIDEIIQLECNIDDMSGEFFADVMDRLFSAGAVDVWFTPLYGKKNRPLYQLSALTKPEYEDNCIRVILEHSSTAGIRRSLTQRIVMQRSFIHVRVDGEPVAVKRLQYHDIEKFFPEWDDCAAASQKLGISTAEIYARAQILARSED